MGLPCRVLTGVSGKVYLQLSCACIILHRPVSNQYLGMMKQETDHLPVSVIVFFLSYAALTRMESQFGRGFITNIMLVCKHFALPPAKAWPGASDHLLELEVPEMFAGTEVDELVTMLRKNIMWHQNGQMDAEDAEAVMRILRRLVLAIDRQLGISDPRIGRYD